jgi:hypothetical protein
MQGIDYNATWAPTSRATNNRSIIAKATDLRLKTRYVDCQTAFLNPSMNTKVFVTLPPGFSADESVTCKDGDLTSAHQLLKSIPGIPQGSNLWYHYLDDIFTTMGLTRLKTDHAVYCLPTRNFFVTTNTDDILIAYEHDEDLKALFAALELKTTIKDLGEIHEFLGTVVNRDIAARRTTINQTHAIFTMLKKAGMADCNPVSTPVATGTVYTKDDCPRTEVELWDMREDAIWYRSTVASCIYFYNWTRPQDGYSISGLCKFMQNPGRKHVALLKRHLRFMKGDAHRALLYSFESPPPRAGVYGYYDSAHLDDVDTRRSTMAYIFFYSGCIISWQSKLHSSVTLSTNHAEYVSGSKASREAAFLENMFKELSFKDDVCPIALFGDSKGALSMAMNPKNHNATKHIQLAHHYTREQVEKGSIVLAFVCSAENIADILTKALGTAQFLYLLNKFTTVLPANTQLTLSLAHMVYSFDSDPSPAPAAFMLTTSSAPAVSTLPADPTSPAVALSTSSISQSATSSASEPATTTVSTTKPPRRRSSRLSTPASIPHAWSNDPIVCWRGRRPYKGRSYHHALCPPLQGKWQFTTTYMPESRAIGHGMKKCQAPPSRNPPPGLRCDMCKRFYDIPF